MFATVCQSGSLTAAANQLCVTKAAVSIALQQLEAQLQHPLFDRVKNRLLLNERGKQLMPRADELLQRLTEIETLFDAANTNGQLKIGASITIGNHLLPDLLAGFFEKTDCRRPLIEVANSTQLCAKLADYELDVALVEGHVDAETLETLPWCEDEMLIVANAEHPLFTGQSISMSSLAGQSWLLREPLSGTREQFHRRLVPLLPDWKIALELNSNESVINAIAAGLGLGFISHLAAAQGIADGRIVVVAVEQRWPRQLSLVYPKDKYISGLLANFIEFTLNWRRG